MTLTTAPGYQALPDLLGRMTGDEKHDPSSYSTLDPLWVLYDRILPREPDARFLLSKGHGPAAYYAVLAAKGLLDPDELAGFGRWDSRLGYHPDRLLIPAVEISSGSLGHGLPIAVGVALAGRRVYCLVGDGELDEGSNWEAIQYAGRAGLGNQVTIVVDNDSATFGWPGGMETRFEAEGWTAERADSRDHDAFERALLAGDGVRPHVAVAEVRP